MSDLLETPLNALTPMNPEVLASPHEFNQRLRREAPVYQCPHTGITFVSDYETVTRIARDHETFSNRFAAVIPVRASEAEARTLSARTRGYPPVDTMLTQDPPLHRRYRGMVNQAFTARRVTTLASSIEKLCHELIDGFIHHGRCEFVQDFAKRVPLTVIAEQLGVPLADYALFKAWSDAFVAQLSRMASADESAAAAELILDYQNYFAARIDERRRNPKDDIISDIVHARFEDERPLDTAEMLSIIQQLLVAGNETTTHAISEGILLLCQHPDEHTRLKDDPSLLPVFVEEVLRLATPTANMWRVVTRDTEINGVPVEKGAMVQIRFSSANRDESKFDAAQTFNLDRANSRNHIAFGHGVHMCIGANLARREMEVAFRVLLNRLDHFVLDCEETELFYPPNVLLRGVDRLPIRFRPRVA